ncbi:MAG TPA: hypothetical protein VJ716_09905 [Gaiellaceae bacterium]|nr:hypothetical protein [Gaiellaceae bacterium]
MTILAPAEDASPARWLRRSLTTFGKSVNSLVPAGFDTYVRVFHPGQQNGRRLRWAEIAAQHGRVAHAGMQLGALVGDVRVEDSVHEEFFERVPGELPLDLAAELARTLERHTDAPTRCWFAVWYGWHASLPDLVRSAPTFALPKREYHLLAGPVAAGAEPVGTSWPQTANLWWPDDHAWCVATEIYAKSTYVGCSRACADELLAQEELEAYEIDPATGIDRFSDEINPPPSRS